MTFSVAPIFEVSASPGSQTAGDTIKLTPAAACPFPSDSVAGYLYLPNNT
jgi:hypothetical protein